MFCGSPYHENNNMAQGVVETLIASISVILLGKIPEDALSIIYVKHWQWHSKSQLGLIVLLSNALVEPTKPR
jgi:hypothetical protein